MFGAPGHAYVYLVYGMYDCLNVVTEPEGRPAALLIRAVEPIEGLDLMRASRLERRDARRRVVRSGKPRPPVVDARLASGPGLVGAAFGIDVGWTGTDLCDPASPLRLEPPPAGEPSPVVRQTPRVGIDYAGPPWTGHAWRFVVAGNPSVSGPARLR
jgi:DNA-3-methyladenine glycosylase